MLTAATSTMVHACKVAKSLTLPTFLDASGKAKAKPARPSFRAVRASPSRADVEKAARPEAALLRVAWEVAPLACGRRPGRLRGRRPEHPSHEKDRIRLAPHGGRERGSKAGVVHRSTSTPLRPVAARRTRALGSCGRRARVRRPSEARPQVASTRSHVTASALTPSCLEYLSTTSATLAGPSEARRAAASVRHAALASAWFKRPAHLSRWASNTWSLAWPALCNRASSAPPPDR